MTASPPRHFVSRGLVVIGVVLLIGALAAWRLAPTHPELRYLGPGPSGMVGWSLDRPANGLAFRPNTADETTVVFVSADWWPACSAWENSGDSWLIKEVSYLPWSVTITLRKSESFVSAPCGGSYYDFWGQAVEVHLSEPLGGRPLFDGSTFPSTAKPYR
jgi:hypothetical protein